LQALGALFDRELDALSFVQALVTLTADASVVDEDVVGALSRYETIAFCIAEPLDGSGFALAHCLISFLETLRMLLEARLKATAGNKNRLDAKAQANVSNINLESRFT
jgi:hypothetical protein